MRIKILLLIFFISVAALKSNANNTYPGDELENKKNDIAGGVVDGENKKPISNVSITAYTSNKKEKVVITDLAGNYVFDDLKPGIYKFVFEKNGYRKVVKDKVQIRQDNGHELNIEMFDSGDLEFVPQVLFPDFD